MTDATQPWLPPAAPPGQMVPPPAAPVTAEGLAQQLAEPFEGFRPAPYQDSTGCWTIGFGSIRVNGIGPDRVCADTPPITIETARQWMAAELRTVGYQIATVLKAKLTVNEMAAIEDFVYNLGIGNFTRSSLLADLNAGRFQNVAHDLEEWNMAGGRVLAGLVRRRAAEAAQFNA